jgi:membrane-associated protein
MDGIFEFLKQLVNPESIIQYGGIYLLLFVVFAETGLFIGFFLPGDSLLFTAGLLCSAGILNIHPALLVLLIIIAAVAGNMTGYSFGKKVGPLLFKRKSGFLFRQEHLTAANEFYIKHGKKNNCIMQISAYCTNICSNYCRHCKIGIQSIFSV